jgi:pyroglutamyl-peptidase
VSDPPPLISLTGFGPFLDVTENPSQRLVERLASEPPPGVRLAARVLPVDFRSVRIALESHWRSLGRRPQALIATGVHRGDTLRVERLARRDASSQATDVSGLRGARVPLPGDWPERLETELDLGEALEALGSSGEVRVEASDDAGGYLCERAYYLTLARARELGVPGLFVHIPAGQHGLERQVAAAFGELLRSMSRARA